MPRRLESQYHSYLLRTGNYLIIEKWWISFPLFATCSQQVVKSEAHKLELATGGSRHKDIFAAACRVGELVGGAELDRELAYATSEQVVKNGAIQ